MDMPSEAKRLDDIWQSIDSVYEYYAKQLGLNSTTLYLLHIIHTSEPCTQKQICDIMMLPKQTVNTIVRDYQNKGLLETTESLEDRRQKHIRLTRRGKDYCNQILPPVAEAEAYAMAQFTDDERSMMFTLMEKYSKSFTSKLLNP